MIRTNVLYTTTEWSISSEIDVFDGHIFYVAWKMRGENWEYKFYRNDIRDIFRWMRWNKIISNDEMKYQIESFDTLTDK